MALIFTTLSIRFPQSTYFLKKSCSNGMVFANRKRIIIEKPLACAPLGKMSGNKGYKIQEMFSLLALPVPT